MDEFVLDEKEFGIKFLLFLSVCLWVMLSVCLLLWHIG